MSETTAGQPLTQGGTAVLELRGGSGALCGGLPDDEDTREELQGFLRFLHVDCLRCEHPLPAAYASVLPSPEDLVARI